MPHKILVIDDEKSICMLLENFFSKKYEMHFQSDGLEALKWLVDNNSDLIICDIQMPTMDGYLFLEKLRQTGYYKHTPVIMLSGVESSKERIRCYRLGAQDFLAKPFNPEELEELIKKNLYPIHFGGKW
jgi:DNA-binding response OmpR family regulator